MGGGENVKIPLPEMDFWMFCFLFVLFCSLIGVCGWIFVSSRLYLDGREKFESPFSKNGLLIVVFMCFFLQLLIFCFLIWLYLDGFLFLDSCIWMDVKM